MGAVLQKYKLSICCSTPEGIACLAFKLSKCKIQGTFNEFLEMVLQKMYIEMKQEVWWVQPS